MVDICKKKLPVVDICKKNAAEEAALVGQTMACRRSVGGRAVNLDFQLDGARALISLLDPPIVHQQTVIMGHSGSKKRGKRAHPREKEISLKLLSGFPPKLHLSVQLCVRPTVHHQKTLHHTYMQ